MRHIICLFFISIFFLPIRLISQENLTGTENDTVVDIIHNEANIATCCNNDSIFLVFKVPWFTKEQLTSPFKVKPQYIDTTLTALQLYDYAYKNDAFFLANKGNVGHVNRNLYFDPDVNNVFSLFSDDYWSRYILSHSDLKFIRPIHVYSELNYVIGSEREQLFYAKHSQKINENSFMGFCYRVISSPGAYTRLGSRNNNLYGLYDYISNNEKYHLITTVNYSNIMNQESGGLIDHVAFEEDEVREDVFLFNAEFRKTDLEIVVNNFYRIGFDVSSKTENENERINDTINNEQNSSNEIRRVNLGRIGHEFSFHRQSFVFEDRDAVYPFFDTDPHNESNTFDSTYVQVISNEIFWSNFPEKGGKFTFPLNFKIFLKHQYINLKFPLFSNSLKTNNEEHYPVNKMYYNQYTPGIELKSDHNRFLSFSGLARYTIGGYNSNDFLISGGVSLGRLNTSHYLQLNAYYREREVPYFFNYYNGNYHGWNNDFNKNRIANASVRYNYSGFNLTANYYILNNMVFMNEDIEPEQNPSTLSAFNFRAGTDHSFAGIGLRNDIVYQAIPVSGFEDFPSFMSYHSLFYGGSLFDDALFYQIGIDLNYNAPYYPSAYMPTVLQFYKQSEYRSQHNFLVDVFLNVKISHARIFLKYQNLGGFVYQEKPVYHIPYYPVPEAMFKFGVSWMFFN